MTRRSFIWIAVTIVAVSGFALEGTFAQATSESETLAAIQNAVTSAIENAEKSVVAFARGTATKEGQPAASSFTPHEYGTGVVIDPRGLILTNYHLLGEVEQSAYMVWHGGRVYFPAKIKAADPWTDLAVIEIEAEELPVIPLVSASFKKGQFVIALGNPYEIAERNSPSATWGIISNLSARPSRASDPSSGQTVYQHGGLIQTDARLKLGSSGGPLVNLNGEMVGLVTSARALRGYDSAASYAIPVDPPFKRVLDRLKAGREVQFGFLGVDWNELSSAEISSGLHGVRLGRIYAGSPAQQHGLQSNDVVTHVDRKAIRDSSDLSRIVSLFEPGTTVSVSLRRTDPILRRSRAIQRDVVLAKRFVRGRRPMIVSEQDEPRRGIRVDYPTAAPDFVELSTRLDPEGCVVVNEVVAGSPAWRAGIRRGDLITHVSETRVRTPLDFYSAIDPIAEDVSLKIIAGDGTASTCVVPPRLCP